MEFEGVSQERIALRGMRHLAIRVTEMSRSRAFYEGLLGLRVVWAPDPENVYLSSGLDNLALHAIPKKDLSHYRQGIGQFLDHFGFLVESPQQVEAIAKRVGEAGATILEPPRFHRDGSCSFYMADPDGNKIQILYEPTLSSQRIRETGER